MAGSAPGGSAQAVENPAGAELKDGFSAVAKHGDEEVLLLLAAQGPIAQENPEVIELLGFAEEKPDTDPEALDLPIGDYLAFEPDGDLSSRCASASRSTRSSSFSWESSASGSS